VRKHYCALGLGLEFRVIRAKIRVLGLELESRLGLGLTEVRFRQGRRQRKISEGGQNEKN